MSGVSTSGVLVQDAVRLCTDTIQMLSISQKDMQRKYQNAGNDWTDSKYQQLGEIVHECNISIKKTLNELERCLVNLNRLSESVEEYESINLTGIARIAGSTDTMFNADRIYQVTNERVVSSYQDRLAHVPVDEGRGQWDVERGNSRFNPSDSEIKAILAQFGEESVLYINAVPDFSPFTHYHTDEWGDFTGEVTIGYMNERNNSSDGYGRRRSSERYNHNTFLGNYEQSDVALAERLSNGERIVTPAEVTHFREENNLTWHECIDMVTVQLIPAPINGYFGHLGGTSEARTIRTTGLDDDLPYV